MSEPRLLETVESLREQCGRIRDAARRDGGLSSHELEDIDDHARRLDALAEQLRARERRLDASSELLANRINNLLMAVQTTADYLAATGTTEDTDRLRQRLIGTINMGKSAFDDVLAVLVTLR